MVAEVNVGAKAKVDEVVVKAANKFSVNPAEYFLVCEPEEANFPSPKHRILKDNDLSEATNSSSGALYLMPKGSYEVM